MPTGGLTFTATNVNLGSFTMVTTAQPAVVRIGGDLGAGVGAFSSVVTGSLTIDSGSASIFDALFTRFQGNVTIDGAVVTARGCLFEADINAGTNVTVDDSTVVNVDGDDILLRNCVIGGTPTAVGDLTMLNSRASVASLTATAGLALVTDALTNGSLVDNTWTFSTPPIVIDRMGKATITVAVPTLGAAVTGYVNVSTTNTSLDGIEAGDVVEGNPPADLQAAGAAGGYYIDCRVSASNTIRLIFVGTLTGANHDFVFSRIG